jgi:hypothetical protein
MPKSVECFVGNRRVAIGEALATQEKGGRCVECREPVLPHKQSSDGKHGAHFEHRRRNPRCALSDHRT